MGRGAYHVYKAEADAARARGAAGAIALVGQGQRGARREPGTRTAAALAGGTVRMPRPPPGRGRGRRRGHRVRGIEANMLVARAALAKAGAPAAMDAGLAAELGAWRSYREALELMAKPDRASKGSGAGRC